MFKKKKVKRELCLGNQKIWFQPLRILYWQFPKPTPYGGNMETMTSFSVTIATSLNILGKCARNFTDDHNLKPNLLSKELETKLGPKQGRLIKGISFRNPKRPYLTKMTLIDSRNFLMQFENQNITMGSCSLPKQVVFLP